MTLLEPDVALTDFALALECIVFAWLLRRRHGGEYHQRFWFTLFFAALGIAALLGGSAHGFISDKNSTLHTVIWCGTLIAIGLAALASWGVSARLIFMERHAVWIIAAASVAFTLYVGAVFIGYRGFVIAIIHYLPPTLVLSAVMFAAWRRTRKAALLAGVAGLVLTFVAAAVQQTAIGFRYFNHNALYHLIQAVALLLVFVAARHLQKQRLPLRGEINADATSISG